MSGSDSRKESRRARRVDCSTGCKRRGEGTAAPASWLRFFIPVFLIACPELAPRDVRAAARFAAALPPGRGQDAAMLVLFNVWTRMDRRAALEWAQGLPAHATRGAALDEVTRRLVAADVQAALTLVAALPE